MIEVIPKEETTRQDDTISRQAAIDGFYEMASNVDHLCTVGDYVSFLESLSSSQAWIPVTEQLPKEDGQYIVTVKYEHVDGYEDIYSEHGEWVDGHWDAGYGHCGRVEKVLAWMPLPEPYEEDGMDDLISRQVWN